MQYSFTCPLKGCNQTLTVEAQTNEEAVDKLTEEAKEHLKTTHPEIKKTDEEVREDIQSQMKTVDMKVIK